jgi:hypothetical protein
MADNTETFNVWRFFSEARGAELGASHDNVIRRAPLEEAALVFAYTIMAAEEAGGSVERVIITDSGDLTCLEWTYGKGLTRKPS